MLLLVVLAVMACFALMRVCFLVTNKPRSPSSRVCVVLGSGGHTSELLDIIGSIDNSQWLRMEPLYVVSTTDKHSERFAREFEGRNGRRECSVAFIPRAREVGQSYFTSIGTTLRAIFASFRVVYRHNASTILCNGPGVCVPIVIADLMMACVTFRRRARLGYFESFTCVDHLSASGTLLRRVSDVFTVQWPGLSSPVIEFVSPFAVGDDRPLLTMNRAKKAIVTVGSTKFDLLMQSIDTPLFFAALKRFGFDHVLIQYGTSEYTFKHSDGAGTGVRVELVKYKPELSKEFSSVGLLITHGGAATILEALRARTTCVAVPNTMLMSDHQSGFARALHRKHLLVACAAHEIVQTLANGDFSSLVEFHESKAERYAPYLRRLLQQ